jgi:uncharacterized protein YndB with AHSA1/START domain
MTDANATPAVVIERTFDAPAELIWKLWTDPQHLKAWYGPEGASIPVAKMDVRVGGTRLVCMDVQTPKGPMQMWFSGEFLHVEENRLLVYTEAIADEHGNATTEITEVRVELEDLVNTTRLVVTHVGIPADSPGATGWTMALAKLAAYVDEHRNG